MEDKQYYVDIVTGLAERTIKRLWIVIILLILLLVVTNAMWIHYETQFEDAIITQDVLQETDGDNSQNFFTGGDYYGSPAKSENNS